MLPSDLGFDPRLFPAYRDRQLDAALNLTTEKRFSLLSAPTGTGKSLIYMTASRLLDARTLILVSTKGLQEQLVADFESLGVSDMRGLSNYRCVAVDRSLRDFGRRGAMCDEGPCRAGVYCSLRHEGGCLYYDAQANARDARIVVTNYSYWMTLGQFSDPLALGAFDLLVLDEAHAAPDLLSDFCAVHIIPEEIKRLLDQTTPSLDESLSVWVDWARNALSHANIKLLVLQERLRGSVGQERAEIVRATLRLNDIGRGLERLAGAMSWRSADSAVRDLVMPGVESGWVREAIPAVGRRSQSIRFTPVWAHAYAEPVLFRGIKKVLLLSATLTQDTSKYLGIAPADMDYREMRSTFDPRRRPLIYVPTVRVDRSMNEGAKRVLVNRIDKVIGDRLDRKGIVHTKSYERAREIVERSRYSAYMMTHTTSTLRDVVAAFKSSDAPAILVSPSVETGFDFPHDECRYQIVAKVPFIDSRSLLVRARAQSDKGYLNHVAAIALIQQCGRGMRSESDLAECVSPDTKVLTDDLRWVAAGDLAVGRRLLAIDAESPVVGVRAPGASARRRWRWSTVEKSLIRTMPRMRVITDHRDLICTPNHPWLVFGRGPQNARMLVWRRTDELTIHDQLVMSPQPWRDDPSWGAGWLSGFADGEACLIHGIGSRNRHCLAIIFSQNEGDTAYRAMEFLSDKGFDFRLQFVAKSDQMSTSALRVWLNGGLPEVLRFLGSIRPQRLLHKFLSAPDRGEQFKKTGLSSVRAVERLSSGDICSLQTSTETYIADGFVAHNTFIFDDHFGWFRRAATFPRWFRDSWRVLDVVPPPPPLPNR